MTPMTATHAGASVEPHYAGERRASRVEGVVVAAIYALLIVIMWAPYTLFSGFNYETHIPLNSERVSWLNGFLHVHDPMRPHTNTFYQVGYVLGEIAGVGGSYVPYQIVHAALWWGRGLLVFLLVRRLTGEPILAYVAGALLLVHASDGALQWAGQINQFGYIFWMLLACYTSVRVIDAGRVPASVALAVFACFFLYMSLWSYESQLPLVMLFPVLLLALRRAWKHRVLILAVPWYGVVAAYVTQSLRQYMSNASATYQAGVMRTDWSAPVLASDWWFNVVESVSFWKWARQAPPPTAPWLALLAVAVFAAGAWLVFRRGAALPPVRAQRASALLVLCGVGVVLLVASFPVYLLLSSVRSMWRTQFLSGIGTAITITAVIALISQLAAPRLRAVVITAMSAVVIWTGTVAALGYGAFHRRGWELQRQVITSILRQVPSVKPGTLVVLRNVPKAQDPFGHVMWFETALELAYYGTWVGGAYFLEDGSAAPGVQTRLAYNKWIWSGKEQAPAVGQAGLKNSVILTLQSSGEVTLDRTLPDGLCLSDCSPAEYSPESRIGRQLSERAARRFRMNGSE
jgi:hypothetical protein